MTAPVPSTTKPEAFRHLSPKRGYQSLSFTIPVKPVPCPRPRMTRYGRVFYPPNYEEWKQQAAPHLPIPPTPFQGALAVSILSVMPPFKTVTRDYPRGDVDNYAKSVLDLITNRNEIWTDDNQVVVLYSLKGFTDDDEPHTHVYIREIQT